MAREEHDRDPLRTIDPCEHLRLVVAPPGAAPDGLIPVQALIPQVLLAQANSAVQPDAVSPVRVWVPELARVSQPACQYCSGQSVRVAELSDHYEALLKNQTDSSRRIQTAPRARAKARTIE